MTAAELAYLSRLPIGQRITVLRARFHWTQQDLAEIAGMSKSYIEKIEQGKRQVERLSILHRIEDALGVLNVLVTRPVPAAVRRVA